MRCPACGRPVRVAGVLSEALLPREVECGGCSGEFDALLALKNSDGTDKHTPDQALALARAKHANREAAVLKALQLRRLQNNAAGKDGDTGALLPAIMTNGIKTWTRAEVMAQAQARLDHLTSIETPTFETAAIKAAKERGLR